MISFIVLIAISIISSILFYYFRYLIPLRKVENGFKYVKVENDGSVIELNNEEMKYVLEKFSPNDGARPYIKSNYTDKTPDGKLHGFILRRRVPKKILIKHFLYQNVKPLAEI